MPKVIHWSVCTPDGGCRREIRDAETGELLEVKVTSPKPPDDPQPVRLTDAELRVRRIWCEFKFGLRFLAGTVVNPLHGRFGDAWWCMKGLAMAPFRVAAAVLLLWLWRNER